MKYSLFLLYILSICIFFSSCQKELTEEKSFATRSLAKIGTDCAPINVEGSYKKNIVLTTGNYADIQVNFATTGSYQIKSDTVNGYSFRAIGQTGLTGMSTVRMQSSGKPLAAGTDVFTHNFWYDYL